MVKLRDGGVWHLFDPAEVPRLQSTFGPDFEAAYDAYVKSGIAVSSVLATQLWGYVCDAQVESGVPFLMYHDNINRVYRYPLSCRLLT